MPSGSGYRRRSDNEASLRPLALEPGSRVRGFKSGEASSTFVRGSWNTEWTALHLLRFPWPDGLTDRARRGRPVVPSLQAPLAPGGVIAVGSSVVPAVVPVDFVVPWVSNSWAWTHPTAAIATVAMTRTRKTDAITHFQKSAPMPELETVAGVVGAANVAAPAGKGAWVVGGAGVGV